VLPSCDDHPSPARVPVSTWSDNVAKQLRGVVIRVADLDEAAARYAAIFGVEPTTVPGDAFFAKDQIAGVRFDLGGAFVQFVAGVGDDSVLTKTTAKLGEGLSQISFWVDDVEAEMALLRDNGVRFTTDEPRDLPLGRVAFGHPKTLNGVVWELEEHPREF